PATKLNAPQRKFTSGDDGPLPRGLAKGLGKYSPRRPAARCGMALHRKAPAKNKANPRMKRLQIGAALTSHPDMGLGLEQRGQHFGAIGAADQHHAVALADQ